MRFWLVWQQIKISWVSKSKDIDPGPVATNIDATVIFRTSNFTGSHFLQSHFQDIIYNGAPCFFLIQTLPSLYFFLFSWSGKGQLKCFFSKWKWNTARLGANISKSPTSWDIFVLPALGPDSRLSVYRRDTFALQEYIATLGCVLAVCILFTLVKTYRRSSFRMIYTWIGAYGMVVCYPLFAFTPDNSFL